MSESTTWYIARNTLILYSRLIFSMVVGLYTSRVVLYTLGVVDYGVYGVVGGIVVMMGFLNTSLSSATSRFITFKLGQGDTSCLSETFNVSFQAHVFIASLLFIFAETIGLFIVFNQLDIPENRFQTALWVYQFSVFSALLGVTQTPYSALLIAHEQMSVFAWIELMNMSMKLVIVWLLQIMPYDHLLLYGLLSFCVSFITIVIYRFYCRFSFPESHLKKVWSPGELRAIIQFTGWNLYSDASVTIRQQGINIIVNRYFGVILNAAYGVASMIQGAVWQCGYNVLAAFQPQITKRYSRGNIEGMEWLLSKSLQWTSLLSLAFSIPIVLCMPHLMKMWLGIVPPFAVVLCQILLIDNVFGLINHVISLAIFAKGNLRTFSLFNGTVKLLCLPCVYYLMLFYPHPVVPYLFCLLILIFLLVGNLNILKHNISQIHISLLLKPLIRPFLLAFISLLIVCPIHFSISQGFVHSVIIIFVYLFVFFTGVYFYIFKQSTRTLIIHKLACIFK